MADLYETPPSGKRCFAYCGDDTCDCDANPRFRTFHVRAPVTALAPPEAREAAERELREAMKACLNAAFKNTSFPGGRWSTGYGCEMAVDALLAGPLASRLADLDALRRKVAEANERAEKERAGRDTWRDQSAENARAADRLARERDAATARATEAEARASRAAQDERAAAIRAIEGLIPAEEPHHIGPGWGHYRQALRQAAGAVRMMPRVSGGGIEDHAANWQIAYLVRQDSGHGGAMAKVRQWVSAGACGPIPWEPGACFKPWADSVGIVNDGGFMRLARTALSPAYPSQSAEGAGQPKESRHD